MLRVAGLEKRFGRVEALRGLDFAVGAGEFFVLLGPSASGKTTTLRTIAGIERADRGSIKFSGADITRAPVQGRDMAMVFQSFALYPHLSIYDNLAYPLREQGMTRVDIARRVADIAEMLGLAHTLKRKPETASGGEQQRIAIGRALIRRPKLLLLDEPITNLDAKLRHDTRAELKRLHRDLGMTMLYATPDELEALSMGQRIGVLRAGRIVQTGTPDELYEHPDNAFVAGMVGSPKMNLIHGKRGERNSRSTVELAFTEITGGPWVRALDTWSPGADLLFGFRPHDISPVAGVARGPGFPVRVHLVEPLGDITILDLEAVNSSSRTLFKMVLPEEQALSFRSGDTLNVELALTQTHVFAADTGVAIR